MDSQTLAVVLLCFLIFFMVFFIVRLFVIAVKNTREFKKFRKNLKVGDEVDEGVILEINGENVKIEKTMRIEYVYPPEEMELRRKLFPGAYKYKEK